MTYEITTLMSVAEMKPLAEAIARSGFFMGIKSPEQALALMAIAQAEGLHPAAAARDYHVIQGKPSLKADAMLARFQNAGGKIQYLEYTDTKCKATFSHPQGGEVTVEWTIEQAKNIGLDSKDTWKKYPRQMLRARTISEGIRTIYPGVINGFYTPEEVTDFSDENSNSKPKTINGEIIKDVNKLDQSVAIEEKMATKSKPENKTDSLTNDEIEYMINMLKQAGFTTKEAWVKKISEILGRNIVSSKELTRKDIRSIIDHLTLGNEFGEPTYAQHYEQLQNER